jgi:hypothetical protein
VWLAAGERLVHGTGGLLLGQAEGPPGWVGAVVDLQSSSNSASGDRPMANKRVRSGATPVKVVAGGHIHP